MVDGVVAPQPRGVKGPVAPVHQQVLDDEIERHLQPERRAGQRAAADADQFSGIVEANALQESGGDNYEKDDCETPEQRHYEKIRKVGRKVGPPPPGKTLVAGGK